MLEQTQKNLLTYICSDEGHNFGVVGEGYYKRDDNDDPIKDKVFRTILCSKCGEAKEICIRDKNVKKEPPVKRRRK